MNRRQFLSVVCGAAMPLPLAVYAQKLGRSPRIGYLSPARLPQLLEALQDGLRELGYIEGQNIVFITDSQKVKQRCLMNWRRSLLSDALFNSARKEIVGLAAQHRLPSIFEGREFVEAGGLLAYGPNIAEMTRRSASLIVKIIKGANPGDLPIEQPTTFELSINVQTGRLLGIEIPATVLLRADKVIE
jgi:hypothetical protein